MENKINQEKHALWIRWAHWINFPILSLMVISGIQIYWANDAYTSFIPDSFYTFFGLDHKLADGMYLHFALAWIFVINGILYLTYLALSGEWRELAPTSSTFKDAFLVLLHDLGLRKSLPPQAKFNGGQKLAYTSVIAFGAVATLSGLAIYKPIQLSFLTSLFFGYETARLIHFLTMTAFLGFFIIHIAQVIRAGWNNFQAMVTGFEVEEKTNARRKFMIAGVSFLAGSLGLWWAKSRDEENAVPWPFRRVLELNEKVWRTIYNQNSLADNPLAPAPGTPARVNSDIGMEDEVDIKTWALTFSIGEKDLIFSMDQLKGMPQIEHTEVFKCVEGWSQTISYKGFHFSELLKQANSEVAPFVGIETPDGDYYVSIDIESMLHPKTLLAFEMNGEPISSSHGAPLRLIIPVKYGIKNIKRIGKISLAKARPKDYWEEQGYDWYAAL